MELAATINTRIGPCLFDRGQRHDRPLLKDDVDR
jgi:hypothetical protein